MFRIVGKAAIRHGRKFGADLGQAAIEDEVKSQFGIKYGQASKPNAGGATAAMLRTLYTNTAATNTAAARAPAPGKISSPAVPVRTTITDPFNKENSRNLR